MQNKEYTVFDSKGRRAVRISEDELYEIITEQEPMKNARSVITNVNIVKAHKCGTLTIIELRAKKRSMGKRGVIGGSLDDDIETITNPFILKAAKR